MRGKPEITRFKGLGEISPDEFEGFIAEDIRLEPVYLKENTDINAVLEYFMGKNTPQRQEFIIDNLKYELEDIEGTKKNEEPEVTENEIEVLEEVEA